MKKIFSILLCVGMLLSLLAGCGGDEGGENTTQSTAHKHTYATEWSYNAESHWYQATCEHSTLQANFGEHVDDNLDGACDICKFDFVSCEHTYSAAWSSDAQFHWHAATCNHIGSIADQAEHADENNDGACDVCAYMGEHTHTYEDTWTIDNTQHWHAATCGHDVVADAADHVDESNDGVCDVCGWFDETHTHTFSEEWTCDVTYHWHAATCEHLGAVSGQEQHVDGDENGYCDTCNYLMCSHVDYDLDGECDTCGGPLDPDHIHEFGNEIGSDVDGHWFVSTCHPGAVSEREAHADENNDGVCDICTFQICGHSYAATWTTDDTHHWHAILCTCSIARKDYAPHEDADGDGGCDVCMFGLPVEAVYEMIVNNQPFTLVEDKMITFAPVVINFPQPGKYVITPSNEEIRVWLTDGSDKDDENAFFNSGSSLTVEVEEAGEMTLWFRYFDFGFQAGKEVNFTYSVVRADNLIIETMQGKVELPANTVYIAKFVAQELGTYKLITGVDGLVIGLTEDTMEYYKGHIELVVTEVGQEFTLWLEYRDPTVNSFIFDWQLVEPFCLSVSEGNFAVDVAPTQIDYKIEFTAPTDGYFLLQVHSQWLTFAQMGDVHDEPVRLETMEVLTHYLTAGEVYTIWLQTVYNYPEATNVYDTLTVTNVGEKLNFGVVGDTVLEKTVHGSSENNVIPVDLQIPTAGTYRIIVTGARTANLYYGEDVLANIDGFYEVDLNASDKYKITLHGEGAMSVKVVPVDYSLIGGTVTPGAEGNRYCFQAPASFYYHIAVTGGELGIVASNGNVTWTSDAYEVNLTQGQAYSFMLRGDGEVSVTIYAVDYSMDLNVGDNSVYMEPNKFYAVNFKYTKPDGTVKDMSLNSSVALTWDGNLTVYINGEVYTRGATITLLDSNVEILLKNNGGTDVKINVILVDDADIREIVEGSSNAQLYLHQVATVAVNRDCKGATAYFTAEESGTYTLTTGDAKAKVWVLAADGSKTEVIVGIGTYDFMLDAGETIQFYIDSDDGSMMSLNLQLTPAT